MYLRTLCVLFLSLLPPGGPGASGLSSSSEHRGFGADSGPKPGGNPFRILILALSAAGQGRSPFQTVSNELPDAKPKCDAQKQGKPQTQHQHRNLEVLKMIFNLFLGPPSPGGSRGRVRSAIFLRKSLILGRLRPDSGDF